jgi:hypothetical protein
MRETIVEYPEMTLYFHPVSTASCITRTTRAPTVTHFAMCSRAVSS